ncbi:MAG: type II toxin-antitoxin system VapC family toxin [Xanthomonadales bacterium]|nr:type II toxin-antitoxin system VapC family toxin [Xanthomonadales bacterium]
MVDSSVWMDHLRRADAELSALLAARVVLVHPFVMGEIACASLPNRRQVLNELRALPRAPLVPHDDVMDFLDRIAFGGRGIGWVDVHLLASCLLAGRAPLFTRDKRLRTAAEELGLSMNRSPH